MIKQWYAKSVTVDELEVTIKEIQDPFINLVIDGHIEYILQKSNGHFLIVWVEQKNTITRPYQGGAAYATKDSDTNKILAN